MMRRTTALSFTMPFGVVKSFPAGATFPMALAVADLNNDGKIDIAVANQTSVAILLGNRPPVA